MHRHRTLAKVFLPRLWLPVAFLLAMGPAHAQDAEKAARWEYRFTPYLWMSGLKGTVGAEGRPADVDLSFSDVLEDLEKTVERAMWWPEYLPMRLER